MPLSMGLLFAEGRPCAVSSGMLVSNRNGHSNLNRRVIFLVAAMATSHSVSSQGPDRAEALFTNANVWFGLRYGVVGCWRLLGN